MIIDKVFNNNVVQVRNDKGEEEIIMGRGLGFQKKPEDLVDDSLVEKRFTLQDSSLINDLTSVYQNLSLKEIETVTAIIEHGQEVLDTVYDMALYISLADHLHYTFERLENGLIINNPLSWEIRKFFPKEFQVARDGIAIVKEMMDIDLPEDEVASLALHFINAQKDVGAIESGQQIAKIVTNILDIVRFHYGKISEADMVSYNRFVTHIQYFAQRVINGLVQGANDSFLFEQVKLNYPQAFTCTEKIKSFVETSYDFPMSKDEQVYLTIHIQRLETLAEN
ncbi:BglG family transcription antiterminator LicT [Streptococcus parauberis]|uniref:PRD domain-containing protein n=2 Tax=Streptococcus parauberis TaxID=1348 RepID=A0A0E2UPN5_9STRE|nr:PRD domain-containing protein [Streptococcus parauberis]AEF25092.1 Putative transcription anti-terminator, BglG family [Streptococcus parauberis KCTC 11537]EGE53613.1 putative transcription antiterminator LicT [Streptococcus parauberis NCFD 2020]EMF49764.1 Beta-glucoside bgl operon antiterminator, BglG family [Streptococcus parauberis KRS-02109]MDT2731284.1 PRD domain-containing protein [Streptococcus parauberis]PCH12278.1 Transcription antiterminator LicT [Streptococcus parauberis]